MFPTSGAFAHQLTGSHTAVARVDIVVEGQTALTLGTVLGGTVTADGDASIVRDATVTLLDEDGTLTPRSARDLLAPFGVRFRPWRGVVLPDGSTELVPLGLFRLIRHNVSGQDGAVVLELHGFDLAVDAEGPLGHSVGLGAGLPVEDGVQRLLSRKVPGLTFEAWRTGHVLPALLVDGEADVWAEARRMARDAGGWLHVNRLGTASMRPYPLTPVENARHLTAGPDATFRDPQRAIVADDLVNVVVVVGTHTSLGGPLVVEVADLDPNSPTSVRRIGRHPATVTTERVRTEHQAYDTGIAELARRLGATETVTFDAIADPSVDPFDSVTMTADSVGLQGRHLIVESVRLPISPADATMSITCRRGLSSTAGYTTEALT